MSIEEVSLEANVLLFRSLELLWMIINNIGFWLRKPNHSNPSRVDFFG